MGWLILLAWIVGIFATFGFFAGILQLAAVPVGFLLLLAVANSWGWTWYLPLVGILAGLQLLWWAVVSDK